MSDAWIKHKISVIIPAFNAGAFIAQAIESALASRNVSVEIIVVDDQSSDDTWDILETFGSAIRKVRQAKGGPYKARNLGAQLARGEWLAFLDADDEWVPDKLAKQLALADEQTGLVYTECLNFGDCSRVKERQSDCVELCEGDIFESLLLRNFITLSSVVMHRTWFEKLGGFSELHTGVQDWDLLLRYAAAGGAVKVVREPLTRYRIHSNQMTLDLDRRSAERIAVVKRALGTARGQNVSRSVARQALASAWEIGAWQAAPIARTKAIYWYLLAARYWPWNLNLYKSIAKCCLGMN